MSLLSTRKRIYEVRADERMLRLALLNLMRNAAEAIAEEKTDRKVFVRAAREGESAMIEVRDTGVWNPGGPFAKDIHSVLYDQGEGTRGWVGANTPHCDAARRDTRCRQRA